MINVISQSLGLGVVNINVFAKVYQNIPNGLQVIDIFANCPETKSSQTGRCQNLHKLSGVKIKCLIIGHILESQPSVSVDFLRVVHYLEYNHNRSILVHCTNKRTKWEEPASH